MNYSLVLTDYLFIVIYIVGVVGFGYWVYHRKKKVVSDTKDFFFAQGSLAWWAIGASLIGSNISTEHFVGMSGEGFFVGLAVAAYEWVAAVALIIIAVWVLPIYLKQKIYTMPQLLRDRYNETVALIMAGFWLFLYLFVNVTSILFLGAVAINGVMGGGVLHIVMTSLAVVALLTALGGMKVIGYTDVIQVALLIVGGLITTYCVLVVVSEKFGLGANAWNGLQMLMERAPDHFQLMLDKPRPDATQEYVNKYLLLPGIAMYYAGQWIANFNYWGGQQYILQGALGADLQQARTGVLFAGLLKLFIPFIVVLPGIAAYVLYYDGQLTHLVNGNKDGAHTAMLALMPAGIKGLSIAVLTAAIVSSLAGKTNSIATIFSLDVYKKYIDSTADEKKLINVGRITMIVSILTALFFSWGDFLGIAGEGGFTFIQKYSSFISPGVFAIFFLGIFWKQTTGTAAVGGVFLGFGLSVFFNQFAPDVLGIDTILYTAYPNGKDGYEIPFLISMGLSTFLTIVVMLVISFVQPKINPKAFVVERVSLALNPGAKAMIIATILILTALYVKFW